MESAKELEFNFLTGKLYDEIKKWQCEIKAALVRDEKKSISERGGYFAGYA